MRKSLSTKHFVQEDEADDLVLALEQELRKRHFAGSVRRLQVLPSMPDFVRQILVRGMKLDETDVYETQGLLGLKDLMSFMALPLPHLKDPPWTPVIPHRLLRLRNDPFLDGEEWEDIFSVIRQQDLLVHHPYESFTASVEHFITHAANDPDVQAIKMTLYRTSGDSPIIKALIAAAENGKQVANMAITPRKDLRGK